MVRTGHAPRPRQSRSLVREYGISLRGSNKSFVHWDFLAETVPHDRPRAGAALHRFCSHATFMAPWKRHSKKKKRKRHFRKFKIKKQKLFLSFDVRGSLCQRSVRYFGGEGKFFLRCRSYSLSLQSSLLHLWWPRVCPWQPRWQCPYTI